MAKKDRINWWKTNFGKHEITHVARSIRNEHVSQGEVTQRFEKTLSRALGVPYCVATTSGSTAILMALLACDIRKGDEVILPNRAWIAAAHAIQMMGALPVVVDVNDKNSLMDVSAVEKKITSRTKAILPVHLGGRTVNMDALWRLARDRRLQVIEDACQAMFSKYSKKYVGTQSDAGCFSLSVAKLISTGQGGFVATQSPITYEKLKLIRTHGVRDVIDVAYDQFGFNFRFTDIQASIGIEQLKRAKTRARKLIQIYKRYQAGLSSLDFLKLIPVNTAQGEVPLYIEVLCRERKRLQNYLASKGVQTRPFYPDLDTAGHLNVSGQYPHSRVFAEQGLFLPGGPDQPLPNIDTVIKLLKRYPSKS